MSCSLKAIKTPIIMSSTCQWQLNATFAYKHACWLDRKFDGGRYTVHTGMASQRCPGLISHTPPGLSPRTRRGRGDACEAFYNQLWFHQVGHGKSQIGPKHNLTSLGNMSCVSVSCNCVLCL